MKIPKKKRNNSIFTDSSNLLSGEREASLRNGRDIKSAKPKEIFKKRNESAETAVGGAPNLPRIPLSSEIYFKEKRRGDQANEKTRSSSRSQKRVIQDSGLGEEFMKNMSMNPLRQAKRINNSFDVQSTTMMHFKVKSGEHVLRLTNETMHHEMVDSRRQKLQNISILPNSPLRVQRKSPTRPVSSFINTVTANLSKGVPMPIKTNQIIESPLIKFDREEEQYNPGKPYDLLGSPEFHLKVAQAKIQRRASERNDGNRTQNFSPCNEKKAVPYEVYEETDQRCKRLEVELSKTKERSKREREKFEEFKMELVRSYEEELQLVHKKYEKLHENYCLLLKKQKGSSGAASENVQISKTDGDVYRKEKPKNVLADEARAEEMKTRALDNQFQLNAIRTMIAVLVKVIPQEIQAEHQLDKYFALVDSLGKKVPYTKNPSGKVRKPMRPKREEDSGTDEGQRSAVGREGVQGDSPAFQDYI